VTHATGKVGLLHPRGLGGKNLHGRHALVISTEACGKLPGSDVPILWKYVQN
jgi:hypothetical protein